MNWCTLMQIYDLNVFKRPLLMLYKILCDPWSWGTMVRRLSIDYSFLFRFRMAESMGNKLSDILHRIVCNPYSCNMMASRKCIEYLFLKHLTHFHATWCLEVFQSTIVMLHRILCDPQKWFHPINFFSRYSNHIIFSNRY